MGLFRMPAGRPVKSFKPQLSAERRPSQPGVLSPDMLEHGAYYAGRIAGARAVARWHAKKQRFVFGEFTLGRQHIRSLVHIEERRAGEWFAPFYKSTPKESSRVSDYAFETTA
jgi:hypothetical protein